MVHHAAAGHAFPGSLLVASKDGRENILVATSWVSASVEQQSVFVFFKKKTETDFHPLNYQGTDLRPNPIIQFLPIKF